LIYKSPSPKFVPGSTTVNPSCSDICEYISRHARVELIELLLDKFGSISRVAREIGVTEGAVRKWVNYNSTHPSNQNLQKIVRLALELDEDYTRDVLKRDFLRHREYLDNLR
jgi:hypothetical protein